MFDANLQYFKFEHLPEKLQKVSQPFAELAAKLLVLLPNDGRQRQLAFTLLLQAKDAAVRSAVGSENCSIG